MSIQDELAALRERLTAQEQDSASLRGWASHNFRQLAGSMRAINAGRRRAAADADSNRLNPGPLAGPVTSGVGSFNSSGFTGTSQPTGMSTLERLRADHSLPLPMGSPDIAHRSANLLADPTFERVPVAQNGISIGTSLADIGDTWQATYVLNSGSVSAVYVNSFVRAGAATVNSGVNSSELLFSAESVGAFDVTITLRSSVVAIGPSYYPQYPLGAYLVATCGTRYANTGGSPTGSATVTQSIYNGYATGDGLDIFAMYPSAGQVVAVYEAPGDTGYYHQVTMRLVGTSLHRVFLFEPQLIVSDSGDPQVFTPAVADFIPYQVRGIANTGSAPGGTDVPVNVLRGGHLGDTNDRIDIDTYGEVKWGSGSAAADSRLYRSGAKALTLDDGSGGVATLNVGGLSTTSGLTFTGATNTSTGSNTDVNISASVRVRWNGASDATWHGIVAEGGGVAHVLTNVTAAKNLTLKNNSGTEATAANRITTPNATDFVLGPGDGCWISYDGTLSLWRILEQASLRPANNLSDVSSAATSATNLGLGTGSSVTHAALTLTGASSLTETSTTQTEIDTTYYSGATTSGVAWMGRKSRGASVGTETAVVAGDTLLSVNGTGMDSNSGTQRTASAIQFRADPAGTVAAGRVDGLIALRTLLNNVGTDQVTIDMNGLVTLAAGQIKFPAAQNASSDANTLDDYEEGTWTAALTYATPGDQNFVYSAQNATYTKYGRDVRVNWNLVTSTHTHTTSAGNLTLTGLPFTASPTVAIAGRLSGYTKANYTQITPVIAGAATTATFDATGSAQALAQLAVGDLPSGTQINVRGSGTYPV